jgi:hypothetical protein
MSRRRILILIKNAGEMLTVPCGSSAVPGRMVEIDLSQRFAGTGRSLMAKIDQYPSGSVASLM